MHLKLGGPTCPFSEEKERKKKKETKNTATGNPLVFALKSRYQFLDSKACRLLCFLVFFTALKGEKSSDVFPGAEASSLFVFFILMLPSSGVGVLDLVFFFQFFFAVQEWSVSSFSFVWGDDADSSCADKDA